MGQFPEMGDSQNGWFTMENPTKMDGGSPSLGPRTTMADPPQDSPIQLHQEVSVRMAQVTGCLSSW